MDRILKVKRMKSNKNKSKITVVSRNKNTNSFDHKIRAVKIKEIKEFKYLRS